MDSFSQLIIFCRYPTPGQAKTRLIPELGAHRAALLHKRMTEHVVGEARKARERGRDVRLRVCFTGARPRAFRAWLGLDLEFAEQHSGDLGERLNAAIVDAFGGGAESVVAVGSDIPAVTSDLLLQALDIMRSKDVVLGHAADGGYYLVGMRRPHAELFADMPWGTSHVYERTRKKLTRLGLSLGDLPLLSDVDRPEDLAVLRDAPRFADVFSGIPLLSVIIPTLNEEHSLGPVLSRVTSADSVEVIVADGGSQDRTRDLAARAGVSFLEVSGGRAAQLNAGSDVAQGRFVLFLHADTLPPFGYADLVRGALAPPDAVAGAFRFETDAPGASMRLIEWTTNFRSRVLEWPYGDQGLFMEKRVFDEMGGFPALPIMEDFEFVRRLRRRGRIVTQKEAAITSARRWRRHGVLKTSVINQLMITGFFAGVSTETLRRLYRDDS